MATLEERLAAIEQEHAELKQKIEMQTLAISGLVNKAMLERINEKNDKIFQALITHDQFTNQQLSELRERVEVQVEGKIVGLQTVVRQGFEAVNARFDAVDARLDTVDARFNAVDARLETMATKDDLSAMNARFEARFEAMDARFDQIMLALSALTPKPD
jgi:predicted transcriptional regulator